MKHFIVVLLLFTVIACNFRKTPVKTGMEGTPLPSSRILLTDSATVYDLAKAPNGDPLILFYFSPHCPYCRAIVRDITSNMSQLSKATFVLVANDPLNQINRFSVEYKLNRFKNIIVGKDLEYNLFKYYNISAVPYTAIYDRNRKLSEVYLGLIGHNQMLGMVPAIRL